MKRLPYRKRSGEFNGLHWDVGVQRAVELSKGAHVVIRIGVCDEYRYFAKGYECRKDELFYDNDAASGWKKGQDVRVLWVEKKPIFEWGVCYVRYGKEVMYKWAPRETRKEFRCMLTGDVIPPGKRSFCPVNGNDKKRSFTRLSVIPEDAVVLNADACAAVAREIRNKKLQEKLYNKKVGV